jgi:hypothetical protein
MDEDREVPTVTLEEFEARGAAHYREKPPDVEWRDVGACLRDLAIEVDVALRDLGERPDWQEIARLWVTLVTQLYFQAEEAGAASLVQSLSEWMMELPVWLRELFMGQGDDTIAEYLLEYDDYNEWLERHFPQLMNPPYTGGLDEPIRGDAQSG